MSVLEKRTYKPADERREQILDCALKVFAAKGFHGSSIADVCARAGIGRATLYQYFDDKRDLLHALTDRMAKRILDAVATRAPLSIPKGFVPTVEQSLAFIEVRFREMLSMVFEDATSSVLFLRAGRGVDGGVDRLLASIDAAVLGLVEADLQAGIDAGIVRELDVKFVGRFFVGGVERAVLDAIDDKRPLDVGRISREVARLQLLGTLARVGETEPSARPLERRNHETPKKKGHPR